MVPARASSSPPGLLVVVTAAVAAAVGYLAPLGWHELQDYVTRKVWIFALIVAVVSAAAGWRGRGPTAVMTLTITVTVLWSVDAATDRGVDGANLWPVGAMFVLVATLAGAAIAATAASALHASRDRVRMTRPAP